jgi:putative ABC transport system ATP-binding protein
MALIEVKDLKKVYKDEGTETIALNEVTFTIDEGEFVAIMGPSGSGKSTLLHILGFLDPPTSGEYIFDGKNVLDYSSVEAAYVRNKELGFIFQAFNLLPKTTVLENVKLPLLYSNIAESKWNNLAKKAIETVGLSHRLNHEPAELSGGEKQRVAIARALVTSPQVIFADEPTGNLDSKSGQAVMEAIQKLNDEGHTIILITHETSTAEHAKRIIHVRDGQIERDERVNSRRRANAGYTK